MLLTQAESLPTPSTAYAGESPHWERPASGACRHKVWLRAKLLFCVPQLERLGVAETGGRDGKRPGLLQRRRVAAPSAEQDSDSQSDVEDGSDRQAEAGQSPVFASAGNRLSSMRSRAASTAPMKAANPTAAFLPDAEAAEQPAAKRQRQLGAADVQAAAAAAREELRLPGIAALCTLR